MLIQTRAIDSHDELRLHRVQVATLNVVERIEPHIAKQMLGSRAVVEASKRRLVGRSPGPDQQAAASKASGDVQWQRRSRAPDGHPRDSIRSNSDLSVKQHAAR